MGLVWTTTKVKVTVKSAVVSCDGNEVVNREATELTEIVGVGDILAMSKYFTLEGNQESCIIVTSAYEDSIMNKRFTSSPNVAEQEESLTFMSSGQVILYIKAQTASGKENNIKLTFTICGDEKVQAISSSVKAYVYKVES